MMSLKLICDNLIFPYYIQKEKQNKKYTPIAFKLLLSYFLFCNF